MRNVYVFHGIDDRKLKIEAEDRSQKTGVVTLMHHHKISEPCNGGCRLWPPMDQTNVGT